MSFEAIIFLALLADSVAANVVAWGGFSTSWYAKSVPSLARFFPMTKGWTTYYLVLVLWAGSLLYRAGALPW